MRERALAEMQTLLAGGLAHKGNDHKQREALNAIVLRAYRAGVPVLEWLAKELGAVAAPAPDPAPVVAAKPAAPEGQKEVFKCQHCEREFSSRHALCGHQRTHK